MRNMFSSVEFWKFVIPLLGAVIAWFANERQKRLAHQYERKEESYKELLSSLKGFYVGAENAEEHRAEFLNQLNICWLYCPDNVIKEGYKFLETVSTNSASNDQDKENALGAFVSAIRNDALSRTLTQKTSLTKKHFRHLGIPRL